MSEWTVTAFARLSIAAALVTLGLKLLAWWLTGSVGLLSDALESLVNVGAAVMVLLMLRLAHVPPDEGHPYGHNKAEYFSSGFEGMLIFAAGMAILFPAATRLLQPQSLERVTFGLAIAMLAAAINLGASLILRRGALRHHSAALQADAAHLLTDVWTSAGVIIGVALVALTGWNVLDPLIAMAVAGYILWMGFNLVRDALTGLMDAAWPQNEKAILDAVLETYRQSGIGFHAIRTRRAAARRFVSFHVLVPGTWTVQQGHDLLERIERDLATRVPHLSALTHLEPLEDPLSYQDQELDRPLS